MAKLVDAHDSGSCEETHGGSTPPIDKFNDKIICKTNCCYHSLK